jgi:putative transposase
MAERGVSVDRSIMRRWVIKRLPIPDKLFCCRIRAVGRSWRMHEAHIKDRGELK